MDGHDAGAPVGRWALGLSRDVSPIDETQDGDLDYVQGLVEYQFDEIWGRSALFLGGTMAGVAEELAWRSTSPPP